MGAAYDTYARQLQWPARQMQRHATSNGQHTRCPSTIRSCRKAVLGPNDHHPILFSQQHLTGLAALELAHVLCEGLSAAAAAANIMVKVHGASVCKTQRVR